ncbi:hypothetical protein LZ30DRAFT_339145 [Colletotrichum cereale]|nr:hypothetical protein LZ30DRAFT_339145 [Colletotrichum cereale]
MPRLGFGSKARRRRRAGIGVSAGASAAQRSAGTWDSRARKRSERTVGRGEGKGTGVVWFHGQYPTYYVRSMLVSEAWARRHAYPLRPPSASQLPPPTTLCPTPAPLHSTPTRTCDAGKSSAGLYGSHRLTYLFLGSAEILFVVILEHSCDAWTSSIECDGQIPDAISVSREE